MSDTTQRAAAASVPQTESVPAAPVGYGHCAWHQGFARDVRLIRIEETASGPGTMGNKFACPPCRQAHDLVPLADAPLSAHPTPADEAL